MEQQRLLTPKEVAEWLAVSPAWVLDHASGRRRPHLPSVKLGKTVRFRSDEVSEFIRECARLNGKGHEHPTSLRTNM
jgi:excisionase family DNA binding protein